MPPVTERPANMAAYGVPDDDEGLLPWSWAEERLSKSRNYWISTVSAAGRPHAMPVWGVWIPSRERFWFSCDPSAQKARNLRANPHVVVAPTDSIEAVSLQGSVEDVSGIILEDVVDAYMEKYGDEMTQHDDSGVVPGSNEERAQVEEFFGQNAAFEVVPRKAFGIIETPEDFGPRATRWRWE